MQITTTVKDAISPQLSKAMRVLDDPKPILEAMGLVLLSRATRAFDDPSLRPLRWPDRKDSNTTHPLLKLSGSLWRSLGLTRLTSTGMTLGSDRPYAAVQQLGNKRPGIPARPFMPFLGEDLVPEAREEVEDVARAKLLAMLE